MIVCRSFFRLNRVIILSCLKLKSFPQLQVCCLHNNLNFMSVNYKTRTRQDFMEQKRKGKISTVWRPLTTQSSCAKESSNELQVESGYLHAVDGAEKVELILAIENEAKDRGEKSEAQTGFVNLTSSSGAFQGNEVGGALESGSMPSDNKRSISLKVGASLMRFMKGKGGSTQKKIEEEIGVRIIFPPSRNEDYIVIKSTSADSIARASERIQSIVDEAVKSPSLDYSHFVSLPLAIHPELVEKLVNFQICILGSNNMSEDENLVSDSKGDALDDKDEENVPAKIEVDVGKEHPKVDTNKIKRVSYAPKVPNTSEQKLLKRSAKSGTGIDKSIFIKPATFHLTVLMLKLWNKDRVAAAAEVLQSVASEVNEALDNRPVSIRLKGLIYMGNPVLKAFALRGLEGSAVCNLPPVFREVVSNGRIRDPKVAMEETMKGSLAKARVIYAPIEEIGSEGRLERACQVIIDAFVEAGLVLEKDAKSTLKLHATVMNARHRKRNQKTRFGDSFDARDIFEKYGSEEWGEYLIPEAHLSQRFVFDENGYYHCCSSISFPKSTQLD